MGNTISLVPPLDVAYTRWRQLDPDTLADPYPLFHRLRAENPVRPAQGADAPLWVLTRYADVAAALRDPRLSVNRDFGGRLARKYAALPEPTRSRLTAMRALLNRWMVMSDPPAHTRLRGLAHRAFTTRTVAAMRERVQGIVDDLLGAIERDGGMDVIAALAYPLPVIVISELLGVPPEDRALVRRWSALIAVYLDGNRNLDATYAGMGEFREYLDAIIAARRVRPRNDLLSALIAVEEEGGRLDAEYLFATCVLLLFAGHETTTNLIGNGLLALLRHREQWGRLCAEPGLVGGVVEEALRYDSPVQLTVRVPTEDVILGGQLVSCGEGVLVLIGAANRDPAQFPDPDRFDIGRTPNRHLAFGFGAHFCLGAALARMEGEIAFATLARRWPGMQLVSDEAVWRKNTSLRGLEVLPVTFA